MYLQQEGAFDEAVQGVDAVAHTASPFHFKGGDPAELIGPAVHGTTGVLVSALKYGSSVRRIVITSSCASVLTPSPEPRVFSEEDWNTTSPKEVQEKGKEATQADKYRASKTLAEKAAWEFVKSKGAELSWDLVVLNPPFVFGPVIHEIVEAEKLNSSMHDWWAVVTGKKDNDYLASFG